MPTEDDWAAAYWHQAAADLRGARSVQGTEPSVLAMLLQMVFEKLGKAALLRSHRMSVAKAEATHQAATTMMQVIAANRRKCDTLGFNRGFVRHSLTPMVERLESLNPSVVRRRGGHGPWLEYPWEDPGGQVLWPARHLPVLDDFRSRHGARAASLFHFAEVLRERFDDVFPR